jgi:hypothetical protein
VETPAAVTPGLSRASSIRESPQDSIRSADSLKADSLKAVTEVTEASGRWDSSSGASTTGSAEVAERNARKQRRRTSRKASRETGDEREG